MKINVASDISYSSNTDYANGLHRVVVETNQNLKEILSPDKYRFSTLNLSNSKKFLKNIYLANKLEINSSLGLTFEDADILLLMDGNIDYVYQSLLKSGSKQIVIALIHDLIPIFHPELTQFGEDFRKLYKLYIQKILKISHHIIFTSEVIKKEFELLGWDFEGCTHVFHLGTFYSPLVNKSLNDPSINIVVTNTIEPRKGYEDILDAFDLLRREGEDVWMTIIGKYGWNAEIIRERILSHRDFGVRLKWYSGISDEEMESIHTNSSISIVASHYEGFGLTLEEGLSYGNKVVARSIGVFKERPNPNLYYFEGGGKELSNVIRHVHSVDWDPEGMPKIRKMRDFASDIARLIEGIPSSASKS